MVSFEYILYVSKQVGESFYSVQYLQCSSKKTNCLDSRDVVLSKVLIISHTNSFDTVGRVVLLTKLIKLNLSTDVQFNELNILPKLLSCFYCCVSILIIEAGIDKIALRSLN